jgi:hypothetical protein
MENDRDDDEDGEPAPCSEAARKMGCTCRWSSINSASLEPPHEIIEKWCPVHGLDPDEEMEKRRDEKEDR